MRADALDPKKFKPTLDKVLVEIDADSITSKHLSKLIILPKVAEDKNKKVVTGVIRAIGPGTRSLKTGKAILVPSELEIGLRVMFGYYVGSHVFEENLERSTTVKFRVMTASQMLGIVTGSDWAGFRPMNDRVLIRTFAPAEETRSKLLIPQTAVERNVIREGRVVSVGSGRVNWNTGDRIPIGVVPGTHVVFAVMGGDDVKIGDTNHVIVMESSVFGVVDGIGDEPVMRV